MYNSVEQLARVLMARFKEEDRPKDSLCFFCHQKIDRVVSEYGFSPYKGAIVLTHKACWELFHNKKMEYKPSFFKTISSVPLCELNEGDYYLYRNKVYVKQENDRICTVVKWVVVR